MDETPIGYQRIRGRLWRISDPSIPDNLRQQLVNELMAARRAIAAAKRTGCDPALRQARQRVQSAKIALGERGPRWWQTLDEADTELRLRSTILALLNSRRPDSSLCPSEVARVVGGKNWRELMPSTRALVNRLHGDRLIAVTQGGQAAAPDARGPIRIARGVRFPTTRPPR